MKNPQIKRFLEIIPGSISWFIIIAFVILLIFRPLAGEILLVIYLVYWSLRLLYMSILLAMAHHRMVSKKNINWLKLAQDVNYDKKFGDIIHVVLYTIYKEPLEVLKGSINALKRVDYPKNKIIVVLAGEQREEDIGTKLDNIKKISSSFRDTIITIHPENIKGEIPSKGANATYAARRIKDYLNNNGYNIDNVIISSFDADTCPDKNYFSCLTYHFLRNSKRYRMSFQPLPVYSNNIYMAPAFARVIEIGSTFWQLIESMRYEKFVTFSSHSMSFKTLVEVGFWPVGLISDDSLIFWKCFLKFNGDYATYSLEVPVYMDIAVGRDYINTIAIQYKQKRRWAWGVETFVFLGVNLVENKYIPLSVKLGKLLQILDNHINWATWAVIISLITPMFLLWGRMAHPDSLMFFNLSYINNIISNALTFTVMLCIFISREFLPPRPKSVSRFIYVSFVLQWLLIPFISAFLGSMPSLDAQTRLMLGKNIGFHATPKRRV